MIWVKEVAYTSTTQNLLKGRTRELGIKVDPGRKLVGWG